MSLYCFLSVIVYLLGMLYVNASSTSWTTDILQTIAKGHGDVQEFVKSCSQYIDSSGFSSSEKIEIIHELSSTLINWKHVSLAFKVIENYLIFFPNSSTLNFLIGHIVNYYCVDLGPLIYVNYCSNNAFVRDQFVKSYHLAEIYGVDSSRFDIAGMLNDLGIIEMNSNNFVVAIEVFRGSLRYDPNRITSLSNLAGVLASLDVTDGSNEIDEIYQRAIALAKVQNFNQEHTLLHNYGNYRQAQIFITCKLECESVI